MKATKNIINEIIKKGEITEKEILLLKRCANGGDKEASNFYPGSDIEIYLTKEQSEKAFKWLWNLYKSPTGKERKNNPFGYREIDILENNKEELFRFIGFYDNGNLYYSNYIPIYEFCGMEYYVDNKIQIVG